MGLVHEGAGRSVYRVRLRLSVFSTETSTGPAHHAHPVEVLLQRFSQQPFPWSSLIDAYQGRQETTQRDPQRKQEQRDVLDHLVAAYRQYHTASGGYFAPCRLSPVTVPPRL